MAYSTILSPTIDDTITLSTSGSGYTVATPSTSFSNITVSTQAFGWQDGYGATPAATVAPSGRLSLTGEGADIEINGASLVGMLKRIEERMNILSVNHKLEEEWDQLRELGEKYRALEAELLEKQKMWNTLKK